ncbi:MAG TPA: hypothetical protein VN249_02075, partial [Prolixibacteraceae bacterium]|nr:hypothetical protein [Prolixibacteraceae bacterium]
MFKSKFRAYLERQQPLAVKTHLAVSAIRDSLYVTIPCHDEPNLLHSLRSLAECTPPSSEVTVIVVVNASDQASSEVLARNQETIQTVMDWWENQPRPFYQLCLMEASALPSKWAGVGWARKIAMDEAVRLTEISDSNEGILIAFDADSLVSRNYFTAIEKAFRENRQYNFVNLHFCHPVDDPSLTPSLREGIILYELYLRYLKNAMQWCGYPHAIHTVGSSFAVKASAYVKQGGMNRRQAGEDFHFLHKIVQLGDYGMIRDATVYPAARISHRVPFGTGAALKKWEEGDRELHSAYALSAFETLRPLFRDPGFFFTTGKDAWTDFFSQLDPMLHHYIISGGIPEKLDELRNNCSDNSTFVKRFYHLVSAFWIIRYLNLYETTAGGKGNLTEEAIRLLEALKAETPGKKDTRELLEIFRT